MAYTAAVITISDKGAAGERVDTSGPALCEILKENGWKVSYTAIIPDEKDQIEKELITCADEQKVNLILTTGGTGFSPRDITPEATLAVVERQTPGIAELMRSESMKITAYGCLSRTTAGIRGRTLIVNLPGSKKASTENLNAVLGPIGHGIEMLLSEGSANCAENMKTKKTPPSIDQWLREAKADKSADKVGMYLTHNGTVRQTAKATVRYGDKTAADVTGMYFSYDEEKVNAAIEETYKMDGIHYIRVWLNEGHLSVGDDIMYVLIGGDIRPHVIDALQSLVGKIKTECVVEKEKYD